MSCLLKSTYFWYHSRSHLNSFIKSLCGLRIVAGFMNTDSMAHGTALWSATFWFTNTRLPIPLAPCRRCSVLPWRWWKEISTGCLLYHCSHHWPRGRRRRSHRSATEWGLIMFPMLPTIRMTLSHACLLTSISRHVNNNWRMRLSSTDSLMENWILWWGCWPEEAARGNWLVFREGRTTDRRMRTRQEI